MSKHSVALVVIAIHEEPYIHEFIRHYLQLGVDMIHIYDNSVSNVLHGIANEKVCITHFPGPQMQMPAYHHFLCNNRGKYRWACFFDVDEFLILRNNWNLHDFLHEYCQHGAVGINWKIFGSSGETLFKTGDVRKRFTRCASKTHPLIKSIVNINDVLSFKDPHFFTCLHGTIDTSRKEITGPENIDGPENIAVLHHYFTKSMEEYTRKRERGRSDIPSIRPMNDFFRHDCNDVEDLSALQQ